MLQSRSSGRSGRVKRLDIMMIRRQLGRVTFLALGVMLMVHLGACTKGNRASSVQQGVGRSGVAKPELAVAPGVSLESLGGKKVELASFRGKPVLIHFWASWCPPCIPELPHMISFAAKTQAKGWTVLAISTDADWQKVKAALPAGDALPQNFVVLLDSSSQVAEAYGSFMYPESYWVNTDGRIERKWVGPQDWDAIAEQLPASR
jgi:peroxiredoxin